jgi:hypothetical protein
MALALKLDAIEDLPRTPASEVKKSGWRGVMRTLQRSGPVLVTNHDEPEAVILSADEYAAILAALRGMAAQEASVLDGLRQRFDARLAGLQADDAGKRLRGLMEQPARLRGKVKAGASH